MKNYLVNTTAKVNKLLNKLVDAEVVGFDTESVGPLLRNRKTRFINVHKSHLLGFSVAFPDEEVFYVPVCHAKSNADYSSISHVLRMVADVPTVWAHNWKHDATVLRREGYPVPRGAACSFLAAWLLNKPEKGLKALALSELERESPEYDASMHNRPANEVLEYVCHDALNTLQLGQKFDAELRSIDLYHLHREVESPFSLLLGEMQTCGLDVDAIKLAALSRRCLRRLEEIKLEWEELFPDVSISSSKQLQELFLEGTWRTKERTAVGQYSTAKDVIEQQLNVCKPGSAGHTAAKLRLEYQQVSKIASTYTVGFIEESRQFPDTRLHPDYNQTGTATGRLSSANPNGQNIPAHGEYAKLVKEAIVPRKGYVYVSADESQVELRVLAHFAGGKLMRAYREGIDVHQQTADALKIDRQLAKTVNFALQYKCGAYKLGKLLGISPKKAEPIAERLLSTYPELDRLRERIVNAADSRPEPYVKTITGRRRYIPELHSGDPGIRSRGERLAINTVIQGSAADIIKLAMLGIRRELDKQWGCDHYFVSQVHDELTLEVRDDAFAIALVKQSLKKHLETAVRLKVPLVAEPVVARNMAECK